MLRSVAPEKNNFIFFLTDGEFNQDEIHRLIAVGVENKDLAKIHVIQIGKKDTKRQW